MCLSMYSQFGRHPVKDELDRHGEITAYKVLALSDDKKSFVSPYRGTPYTPGIMESDRKDTALTEEEKSTLVINHGIHVFLNPNDAIRLGMIIVPVKCYKEDFVAEGVWSDRIESAVFTKVFIDKVDYDATLKQVRFILGYQNYTDDELLPYEVEQSVCT